MHNFHETMFDSALYLSYILYFVAYFNIGIYSPEYLTVLQSVMKYYVILFLLIRFNPLTNTKFTEFDRKLVFSSAIFLLTTTTFNEYAQQLDLLGLAKKMM
jgi:hypothetical protein